MTLDLFDGAGRAVRLTRGEFALLAALARQAGRVVSRDRLLDAVSGRSAGAFDRSIDNMVARLRRKIERDAKKPHLIVTVPGVGYKFVAPSPQREAPPRPCTAASDFSLLVLPFASLGDAALLSHFANGVSTMLAVVLRHVVGGTILGQEARCSVATDVTPAIGRRLGARYVICGCVRRSGDRLRVNASLTDAQTGAQIWAERIDGGLTDLFSFEAEVTARIARAIELELIEVESRGCGDRRNVSSPTDLVTSGRGYLNRPRSAENLRRARALFESALRLDGGRPEAIAELAQTRISDALNGWSSDPAAQVRDAEALATRAIEMNPRFAYAYYLKGLTRRVQERQEQALAALDRAIQLTPSLAPAHVELGFTRQVLERGSSAFAHAYDGLTRARRISPRDPVLANWLCGLGVAHVQIGESAEGIRLPNESIGLNPLPPAVATLAAAYALTGEEAQARRVFSDFTRQWTYETLHNFSMRIFADRRIFPRSRIYAGLRKAGPPEL